MLGAGDASPPPIRHWPGTSRGIGMTDSSERAPSASRAPTARRLAAVAATTILLLAIVGPPAVVAASRPGVGHLSKARITRVHQTRMVKSGTAVEPGADPETGPREEENVDVKAPGSQQAKRVSAAHVPAPAGLVGHRCGRCRWLRRPHPRRPAPRRDGHLCEHELLDRAAGHGPLRRQRVRRPGRERRAPGLFAERHAAHGSDRAEPALRRKAGGQPHPRRRRALRRLHRRREVLLRPRREAVLRQLVQDAARSGDRRLPRRSRATSFSRSARRPIPPAPGTSTTSTRPTATASAPFHPNCPCVADQPLIGADHYGFYISTNEYSLEPFGAFFNGAQVYAFNKAQLAAGAGGALTGVHFEGIPLAEGQAYTIQPATTPAGGAYDLSQGGTAYALSALDFNATLDNRIAVWALTGTSTLGTTNQRRSHRSRSSTRESTASRRTPSRRTARRRSATPRTAGLEGAKSVEHLELLAGNDDRMNEVKYADGMLWGDVNTVVKTQRQRRVGIAWFAVRSVASPSARRRRHDRQPGLRRRQPGERPVRRDRGEQRRRRRDGLHPERPELVPERRVGSLAASGRASSVHVSAAGQAARGRVHRICHRRRQPERPAGVTITRRRPTRPATSGWPSSTSRTPRGRCSRTGARTSRRSRPDRPTVPADGSGRVRKDPARPDSGPILGPVIGPAPVLALLVGIFHTGAVRPDPRLGRRAAAAARPRGVPRGVGRRRARRRGSGSTSSGSATSGSSPRRLLAWVGIGMVSIVAILGPTRRSKVGP